LQNIVSVLKAKFNPQTIHLSYMDSIVEIALNDKKNSKNEIRCVLLNGVGDYKIDMAITPVQIKKALEYYNSVVE
jgi:3-dehydroquinate synthetase